MIPAAHEALKVLSSSPRTRGDDPRARKAVATHDRFSPHPRG